jgi:prolyl-tRNA synthetase
VRRSALFCETLRQAPADAEFAGYQYLLRGGYVHPQAAGIYSLLPLGLRVKRKVERVLREEMEAIGGQEIVMPVVQPADLWQESGRWQSVGQELARLKDRNGRDLALAMTHEEAATDVLRGHVHSYRQLPLLVFQIQTKFRDEPRSRGGLIRLREFTMKDAYSADLSVAGLDASYQRVYGAYLRIFERLQLAVLAVNADVGMMGGSLAHEFMFVSDAGEDTIVVCAHCGSAANQQVAVFGKEAPPAEDPLPLEPVETPATPTIAALATLLNVPASRTAKAAFFMADDRLVFAVVRGDMEVNETKLASVVGARDLRFAAPEDLVGTGIVPGYASPIGIHGALVVVDDLVVLSPNLVAGANREGYHLRNTNVPRDYQPDIVADIVKAHEGAACASCGAPVHLERAVEVGNIFKLGTRYSRAFGATYLSEDGQLSDIVMGSYGIGVERLIACLAEAHHDDQGLVWPPAVAPFDVYLTGLDLEHEAVRSVAEALYRDLQSAGVEVLYDDRDERAGVKFKDADLLGLPLRVTVSRRTLARNAVELKGRAGVETCDVALEQAARSIAETVSLL